MVISSDELGDNEDDGQDLDLNLESSRFRLEHGQSLTVSLSLDAGAGSIEKQIEAKLASETVPSNYSPRSNDKGKGTGPGAAIPYKYDNGEPFDIDDVKNDGNRLLDYVNENPFDDCLYQRLKNCLILPKTRLAFTIIVETAKFINSLPEKEVSQAEILLKVKDRDKFQFLDSGHKLYKFYEFSKLHF